MKNTILGALAAGALLVGGVAATSQSALADGDGKRTYRVTVANATGGQPLAPGLIITHRRSFSLFQLNGVASHGLAVMAETGNPGELAGEVLVAPGVKTANVLVGQAQPPAPPVAVPGESNSLVVSTRARFVSVAGMLAATNDAFYAVRGLRLPRRGSVTVRAVAYDAGSEFNSELGAHIPAFGNDAFDLPIDSEEFPDEGFIHIHNGVHGVGGEDGLNPATHDWRNPVVQVTVERIRKHDDDDD